MDILEDLNAEQKQAVTHPEGPLLIVAGAGTGKTTVITRRIAWLVLAQGVCPESILALTFTNKAAAEMEERVDRILPYGYVDLWVSTFHTFCQKILQDHALDIGLSPDAELLDETGQWLLVRENLAKFDLDYYKPAGNPTKFIRALLSHFSRLKDEEISSDEYLAYAEGLAASLDGMEASGGRAKPLKPPSNSPLEGGRKKKSPPARGESLQFSPPARGGVGGEGEEPEGLLDEIKRTFEAAKAYHTYQQLLLDNNKMDFGDLINYTLKILRERGNVLAQLRQQFKYILVDEFQDTNWAQYDLVRLLAAPTNNLTVVADDDQSIYRFRGASMSNVMTFVKDYPAAAKVSLIKNYRSGQAILDLSHAFIQLNNPNRLEYKGGEGVGGGMKGVKGVDKKLIAQTAELASINHIHAKSEADEARLVAETILALKKQDSKATWNDFAVLVRANSQAAVFEEMIAAAAIPHQNYSAVGLYRANLVANLLAFFNVLDDYHESRALFRLLALPFLGLPMEDIIKLTHHAAKKRLSLYSIIKTPQIAGVSDEVSLGLIEKVRVWIEVYSERSKAEKPAILLLDWLNEEGYMDWLNKLPEGESAAEYRLLKAFWDRLKSIETVLPACRVRDVVDFIRSEMASGQDQSLPLDIDAGPEMVKIMTIHSAKGLEFKYVFVTNLVDRRFPTTERRDLITIPDALVKEAVPAGNAHLEEERRLFYVALTRAKRGLFLTSAENYGGTQKKKLSRFLKELAGVGDDFKTSLNALGQDAKDFLPRLRHQLRQGYDGQEGFGGQAKARNKTRATYQLNIPKKFSYTQLKIFDNCPFAYKMEFVLRVPKAGKHVFSYGTTMHATLQHFFQLLMQRTNASAAQGDLFGVASELLKPPPSLPLQPEADAVEGGGERIFPPARGESPAFSPPARPVRRSPPRADEGGGGVGGEGEELDIPASLAELLEIYEKNWLGDWYESEAEREKAHKQGRARLKFFYESLKDGPLPRVKALERSFNIKLGDYVINGKMDRVDSCGDGLVNIIDYKTGTPRSKLDSDAKRQLLIYQIAAEEVFKEKVNELTYLYLDNNQPVSFIGKEKDKDGVKDWMREIIQKMHKSDFAPNPKQHSCDFCPDMAAMVDAGTL